MPVYPRVHGGTRIEHEGGETDIGLSPRARGNLHALVMLLIVARSIPACTGEPITVHVPSRFSRVYPRVHGGTLVARGSFTPANGLSPRARGNPAHLPLPHLSMRSIPACTGEPARTTRAHSRGTVYPRVHGGTWRLTCTTSAVSGLSPRARGNPGMTSTMPSKARSIPACTGEPKRPTSS